VIGKWIFYVALIGAILGTVTNGGAHPREGQLQLSGGLFLIAVLLGLPMWIIQARRRKHPVKHE
jgi:hypothetical protein